MIDKQLSFHLLMQHPPFAQAVKEDDKEVFEQIIYEAGIDTSLPYEVISVEHRPYPNKPFVFNGPCIIATERSDKEWLNGDLASWDAKREAIRDPSMRSELLNIGREGGSDKVFTNEDTARNYIRNEKNKEF